MIWCLSILISCGVEPEPAFVPGTGDTRHQVADRCEDPQEILTPTGAATGYVLCADGSINRAVVGTVEMALYEDGLPLCRFSDHHQSCNDHEDCTEMSNGRCVYSSNEFIEWCHCTYLCSEDSDCPEGTVCLAPEANETNFVWPRCVSATCTTNSNCSTEECGVSGSQYQSESHFELACRNGPTVDVCRTHADCERLEEGNFCWPDGEGIWTCVDWHPID